MLKRALFVFAFQLLLNSAFAGCDLADVIKKSTRASVIATASTGDMRLRAIGADILVYCDRPGATVYGHETPPSRGFFTVLGVIGKIVLRAPESKTIKTAETCLKGGDKDICMMLPNGSVDCWDGNICRVERW
jgi:hypothetical protein